VSGAGKAAELARRARFEDESEVIRTASGAASPCNTDVGAVGGIDRMIGDLAMMVGVGRR
jgi:hypothetical protein